MLRYVWKAHILLLWYSTCCNGLNIRDIVIGRVGSHPSDLTQRIESNRKYSDSPTSLFVILWNHEWSHHMALRISDNFKFRSPTSACSVAVHRPSTSRSALHVLRPIGYAMHRHSRIVSRLSNHKIIKYDKSSSMHQFRRDFELLL